MDRICHPVSGPSEGERAANNHARMTAVSQDCWVTGLLSRRRGSGLPPWVDGGRLREGRGREGGGGGQLLAPGAHSFQKLGRLVFAPLMIEIGHAGRIYTTEISEGCKSAARPSTPRWLVSVYQLAVDQSPRNGDGCAARVPPWTRAVPCGDRPEPEGVL